jgi:uncharacterized repeat protein (TIGR01451 family)
MKALKKAMIVILVTLVMPAMGIGSLAGAVAGPVSAGESGALLQAKESYGRLPMSFEPNKGQSDEQVSFLSRGSGYNLFLTRDESVLVLRNSASSDNRSSLQGAPHLRHAPPKFDSPSVVRMKFPGANSEARIEGTDQLPGRTNYLNNRDSGKWHTDVAQYARVEYHELYPGVDLVYYGNRNGKDVRLEHDFIVKPGSDPAKIRFGFEGVERMEMNASGDLVLRLPEGGELIQHAPVIYQESDGVKKPVKGGYVILGSDSQDSAELPAVGFKIAEYDPGKTLYIDPLLSYSTYLGGTDYDFGYGIAVDSAGCAYITGWSYSVDFPTKKPLQLGSAGGVDVFVAKLNATGNALLYSTYVGGSGDDFGTGIAVDSTGAAYVTGYTDSTDFPATAGVIRTVNTGLHDAFVFKVNAAGTALTYSTYLGGTGEDYGTSIAVGSTGAAYVTGYTASTDFPMSAAYQGTKAGAVNAFVAEINAAGTALTYSTYIGGTTEDYATAIALDSAGLAYITGYTNSADYPTTNAYQSSNAGGWDAFITAVAADGSALPYSTYLGGTGDDFAYAIAVAVDSASPNDICAYVTGSTSSSDLPSLTSAVSGHAYQMILAGNYDAFVSKVDPALTTTATLVYSTYLGGEDFDAGNGIAVDSANNAYVVGETWSQSFPVKTGPFQGQLDGGCDGFVSKINPTGSSLTYGSFIGGADYDAAMAVALDSGGNLYLTGYTYSTDFPVLMPLAGHVTGTSDAFAAKISPASPPFIPLPDLTVPNMTVPVSGIVGQKISVSTTVKNIGVITSAPCKVGLYLSTTQTTTPWKDSRNIFLGSRTLPSLKINVVSTASTAVYIPPTVPAGSYYLVAVADSGHVVEESDETNNTLAKPIKINAARPDLIAVTVSSPTTAKLGQTIKITSTVKNQGYATARNFYVGVYLSSDLVITSSDTLIGTRLVSSLAAGSSNTASITTQIPVSLTTGTYYIGMIVDNNSDISELIEINNTKTGNKIIISP